MPTTPNMGLLLPTPTVTPGPTYASEIDTAFDVVDAHDHTTGKGLPITSAAIDINADLAFNAYNITEINNARFTSQSTVPSTPSDTNELAVVNGNLYYINNLGQPVQITEGATLDATSIGGIGGDFGTSTASVFYTSADKTFTFWSNTNTPASIDAGNITIRNDTLNSFGITLAPNASIASDYQITLPAALPSQTSALELDTSGNVVYGSGGINPPGAIVMFGGASAPSGYLLCDGTSYLRTAQANLFTAIGTAYGSADGTHFNVPDLRGAFPRGVTGLSPNDPDASSRTASATGGNTGNNVGSVQGYATEAHTHTIGLFVGTGNISGQTSESGSSFASNATTSNESGSLSTETRPLNVYVNFIIKT